MSYNFYWEYSLILSQNKINKLFLETNINTGFCCVQLLHPCVNGHDIWKGKTSWPRDRPHGPELYKWSPLSLYFPLSSECYWLELCPEAQDFLALSLSRPTFFCSRAVRPSSHTAGCPSMDFVTEVLAVAPAGARPALIGRTASRKFLPLAGLILEQNVRIPSEAVSWTIEVRSQGPDGSFSPPLCRCTKERPATE